MLFQPRRTTVTFMSPMIQPRLLCHSVASFYNFFSFFSVTKWDRPKSHLVPFVIPPDFQRRAEMWIDDGICAAVITLPIYCRPNPGISLPPSSPVGSQLTAAEEEKEAIAVVEGSALTCFSPLALPMPPWHTYTVSSEMHPDRINRQKAFGGFSQLITRARKIADVNMRRRAERRGLLWVFTTCNKDPKHKVERRGVRMC